MDAVLLVILVLGAVIFFGALISAGNERQRKALDGIREQAALWAMQDLPLKREKLVRDVKVDDPAAWLNQVVTKVYGESLELTLTEFFDPPPVLVYTGKDGQKIVFSSASPDDIRRIKIENKSKLSRLGNTHPLMDLPRGVAHLEISILNGDVLFDLEIPLQGCFWDWLFLLWGELCCLYISGLDQMSESREPGTPTPALFQGRRREKPVPLLYHQHDKPA